MLFLITILGLPALGGALLALDHYVRFNASRDQLSSAALVLRVLGLSLACAGVAAIVVAAMDNGAAGPNRWAEITFRLGAGAYGLFSILAAVVGNAFRGPRDSSELREELRLDQRASTARLLWWAVLLMPLAPLIPAGMLVVPVVLTTIASSWGAINRGNQISLLWRLLIATKNNLPYADEVEAAAPGAGRARREGLFGMADRLRNGQSLSDALGDRSPLLPRGDVLAIRAADGTPALPKVLEDAALRSVYQLGAVREGGAVFPMQAYVVNVVLILLAIMGFQMYYIVPKFKMIFNDFDIELPGLTKWLISVADDIAGYWFVIGPLASIPLLLMLGPPLVVLLGWDQLNFPPLMRWFPRRDAPEVLRLLAAIVESGRPLATSLEDLAQRHPREDLRPKLDRVAGDFEEGATSWNVLVPHRWITRSEAAALDAAAANGHLAWALRSQADSIDTAHRRRASWILEWQRPVLITLLGVAVAIFCVAMFLPLVRMIDQVAELAS